jgi:hypothetical protein
VIVCIQVVPSQVMVTQTKTLRKFKESSKKTDKISFWQAGQALCMEHAGKF